MPLPAATPMTVDEFLAWQAAQPEGARHELVAGEAVAMAPERLAHVRLKMRVWRALADAIAARGLSCEAFGDGATVRIDDLTAYEPDAVVQCGPPLPGDTLLVPEPLIVVEVLSPATGGRDAGAKLDDYFRLPSVMHYLLVKTERPAVIHHARGPAGRIDTRIVTGGTLTLSPPGLSVDVEELYGASNTGGSA